MNTAHYSHIILLPFSYKGDLQLEMNTGLGSISNKALRRAPTTRQRTGWEKEGNLGWRGWLSTREFLSFLTLRHHKAWTFRNYWLSQNNGAISQVHRYSWKVYFNSLKVGKSGGVKGERKAL